jgi:hypothetical protein
MITILSQNEYASYLEGNNPELNNAVTFSDIVLIHGKDDYLTYKNRITNQLGNISGVNILKLFMNHKWSKR